MGHFQVTKTYGHELGLSACFRQPKAESHCRHLHGYALSFKLTYEAIALDRNNWVIDFGSLKPIKQFLVDTFDHRTIIAADDPSLSVLRAMQQTYDNISLVVVPQVGCEAFAYLVAQRADAQLEVSDDHERVRLVSVECREHGANSAIYYPPVPRNWGGTAGATRSI